jgi:anti-anti-sigma regulatory factor
MSLEAQSGDIPEAVGAGIFRDGDTLILSIPAIIDLSLYTVLHHFLRRAGRHAISHILIDLSAAETLCNSGVAALLSLERLAGERDIRVLALDAPGAIREQLVSLFPDSSRLAFHQGSFGRDFEGRLNHSRGSLH